MDFNRGSEMRTIRDVDPTPKKRFEVVKWLLKREMSLESDRNLRLKRGAALTGISATILKVAVANATSTATNQLIMLLLLLN